MGATGATHGLVPRTHNAIPGTRTLDRDVVGEEEFTPGGLQGEVACRNNNGVRAGPGVGLFHGGAKGTDARTPPPREARAVAGVEIGDIDTDIHLEGIRGYD